MRVPRGQRDGGCRRKQPYEELSHERRALECDALETAGLQVIVLTGGTFDVEPISVAAIGDELLVTRNKNRMTLQVIPIEADVVVV